jgi:thymidylate synthase ThyX/Zn ribbon nucleic-acid-binding protein
MHNAKLISVTHGAEEHVLKSAQDIIMYCARVSNPQNQDSTNSGLLKYCIKNRHWSIFEMANMVLEISTTRAISPQILRHRSFSFQEFCLSGSSRITIVSKKGVVQRIPIKELYDKWQKKSFKARYARAYDTELERFITAPIKSVYCSGKKPVFSFEIETNDSKRNISCTREHRVLTKEKGFVPFGVAYDERLTVALNGVTADPLPYQDPETLKANAWMGSTKFAHSYGIAEVTARKWFRKHGVTPYNPNNAPASSVNASFSARLGTFMKWARNNIRAKECQHCGHDGSVHRLEVSHIEAHNGDSNLAFDENNLQTLCSSCHREYDMKKQGKTYGWTLGMTAKWGKISSQTYTGIEETYDIEMDHPTHNFIADGIVVHNSQRYADVKSLGNSIPLPLLRRQDDKNRQASHNDLDPEIVRMFWSRIDNLYAIATDLYDEMLSYNIAKECAREVLPIGTPTKLYMNGNLRSWITYIALREKNGTQLEHQMIAKSCKEVFCKQFPVIADALGGLETDWEV